MRGRFTLLASQLCRLELIFSSLGWAGWLAVELKVSAAIGARALCSLRASSGSSRLFFFFFFFSLYISPLSSSSIYSPICFLFFFFASIERKQKLWLYSLSYSHSPLFALRYRGFSLRLPPALRSVSRRCRRSDPKKRPFFFPLFFLSLSMCTRSLFARAKWWPTHVTTGSTNHVVA